MALTEKHLTELADLAAELITDAELSHSQADMLVNRLIGVCGRNSSTFDRERFLEHIREAILRIHRLEDLSE